MNNSVSGRDPGLDAARGFAMLCIVWMHTVFWSGLGVGIPQTLRLSSLLFDVPMFFLISGMLAARQTDMERSARGIVRLYAYYAVFLSICFAGKYLSQGASLDEWSEWLLFRFPPQNGLLRVVAGSAWFMPVFIMGMLVAMVLRRMGRIAEGIAMGLVFCAILLIPRHTVPKPAEMLWNIIYFSGFILLGMQLARLSAPNLLRLTLVAGGLWLAAWSARIMAGYAVLPDLNEHKFAHDSVFLFYTVPSLLVVVCIKLIRLRNAALQWLGRRAMSLYLAQGVCSSALYYVVPYTDWLAPLPRIALHFLLNAAMTIALASVMHEAWRRVETCAERLPRRAAR